MSTGTVTAIRVVGEMGIVNMSLKRVRGRDKHKHKHKLNNHHNNHHNHHNHHNNHHNHHNNHHKHKGGMGWNIRGRAGGRGRG